MTDGREERRADVIRTATCEVRPHSGGRVGVPDAGREALGIEDGDIVRTVVLPVNHKRSD